MSRETLLAYPNCNEPFEIHTDASKLQLRSVKKGQPIRPIEEDSIRHKSITLQLNLKYYNRGNK